MTKIKVSNVWLYRLDCRIGDDEYRAASLNTIPDADKVAREFAKTAPDDGTFDKYGYAIRFDDDHIVEGEFGLQRKHADGFSLKLIVQRDLLVYAGHKPNWLSLFRWKLMHAMHKAIGKTASAQDFLEKYELA